MDAELLKLIGQGGIGAIIMATLYGLSLLITAWRGGSASKAEVEQMRKEIKRLKRVEKLLTIVRFQRDQGRLKADSLAEKLGLTLPPWSEEPEDEGDDDE